MEMPSSTHINSLAIVGAGGNVGTTVLKHLLKLNTTISITIITRADSSATFPSSPQISVRKGSYDDTSFLESALSGNEMALFALSLYAGDLQTRLIEVAAKAKVQWILPSEFSADGSNETLIRANEYQHDKPVARQKIEGLGMKWIAVVTNPWIELCLQGPFGFNIPQRTATFYKGSGSFNTTSMDQVGRGTANLISLPIITRPGTGASLEQFSNSFVYISSFLTSQQELFDSIKRVTKTSDKHWKVEISSISERIRIGQEKLAVGNFEGAVDKMLAYYMGEGLGGDIEAKCRVTWEMLGLLDEEIDEVVGRALSSIQG